MELGPFEKSHIYHRTPYFKAPLTKLVRLIKSGEAIFESDSVVPENAPSIDNKMQRINTQ